jgi:ornithine carbamoyltransferase
MRHFLTITDVSRAELYGLLLLARQLKRKPKSITPALRGKTVALVFQKPSMRTRVAFEVAVHELGGSVVYLGQDDIQLGRREPIKDVARALSRYVDAIVARTFAHEDVEEFSAYATCPVINGLSDLVHPCQALADLFTLQETFNRFEGLRVAYVGDGNNVLHSLAQGCAMVGVSLAVATPRAYRPDAAIWRAALRSAKSQGASLRWTLNPREAVEGADVVYTDVWVSMGKERQRSRRLVAFRPYQVNGRLLQHAKAGCRVMHCLPAHRGEEITEDVLEGSSSVVFEQAENRLHVQKALLAFLFTPRSSR